MRKLHERVLDKLRHWLRESWYFLSSMFFLKSFGKMLAVTFGIFLLLHFWMRCYTNHGESYKVENYVDLELGEAIRKIEKGGFRPYLSDSIYSVDKKPGIVIDQNPVLGEQVKQGRRIYLTITKRTPDEVLLPKWIGGNYDFDQYAKKLRLLNVQARIREQVFDSKLEPNSILHFFYKDRKVTEDELNEGLKVPMGSVLEFVVTTRTGGRVELPELVCLSYSEAEFLITSYGLKVGNIREDNSVVERPGAYVEQQFPPFKPGITVPLGSTVDVFLTQDVPLGCGG